MITSPLPVATRVHPANGSPTRAAALPFILTVLLPALIEAVCDGHLFPGFLWLEDTSPTRAAPRPLIVTSLEAEAMV